MRDSRLTVGLILALVSAASFGLSGTLATALVDAGWSAGAAVSVRIGLAGLVLQIPSLFALRGRFALLRRGRTYAAMAVYGVVAIAIPQLCYFYAVVSLQVAVALLVP